MLHNRLSRLERVQTAAVRGDGLPACAACDSANNRRPVVRMEGNEPFPPLPTCPACGRTIAFVINIRRAVPPVGWSPTP